MIVHEQMSINSSTLVQEKKNFTEEISFKIKAFQKKEGIWITPNCQHILHGNVHYYGIHKDQQMQLKSNSKETILATRKIYEDLKLHVLQNMGLPSTCKVIQVVGDSAAFSLEGTEKAKAFLTEQLPSNSIVLFGFTGHKENDGTRCVNAALADVIEKKEMLGQTVGNLVGFHTPTALQHWGCSGPEIHHYIIVYGDDESCKENGTLFGDDVTTSDFFSDSLLMLDGGAQSFRQACNALLLDQNINVLSGLRSAARGISIEIIDGITVETPFFGAAKFLRDVTNIISKHGEAISEDVLQNWYKNYFGMGKCYVGNPSKGDFDTKQKLMDDAWDLFISGKLYLKIGKLVTHK